MLRTKIVFTIGPASESPETIRVLIKNGMNVARLNFSHGSHLEHGDIFSVCRYPGVCSKPKDKVRPQPWIFP
ncbi:MAG: hypothetical protein DRG87_00210 [Deltaproteobacteria bacterium]|nr:hypothetical protein [Deltaproteobacteria bacterium]RLB32186.1 MAG: hypothetical protein DRG87_00210 [Deltaproteobacteria bacterium]